MLTTNDSLATEETITGDGTGRTVSQISHGGTESPGKVEVTSILSPSMGQLEDFFELLPLLKSADICVFTEAGICRLSHTADPFEATNDLIDRGVRSIIILRPHSIVVAIDDQVEELCTPTGFQPCEHVREYVREMQASSISIQPLRSLALAAIQAIFAQAGRKVLLRDRSQASIVIGGFMRMLSRCVEWASPSAMVSGQSFATGERTETSSGELSLKSMSISTD